MTDTAPTHPGSGPKVSRVIDHLPRPPRWMQAAGVLVFTAVLVLLAFVLPPLFDSDGAATGGHNPPAGGPGPQEEDPITPGSTAPTPRGRHTPPSGLDGAPAGRPGPPAPTGG